jgi:hypothetical protein
MGSSPFSNPITFKIHQNHGNEKGGFSRPSSLMTLSIPKPLFGIIDHISRPNKVGL